MTTVDEVINKHAVAQAFSRAAQSYDNAADLQRRVGNELMQRMVAHPGSLLLDAGCGTGHFSRCWRARGKTVYAVDLAPGMLEKAAELGSADRYLLGDIDALSLPDGTVDLVFSNLVVQWCGSLRATLAELYRVTRPGGMIAFSTLVQGSLWELSHAWQQVDGQSHVNHFLSDEQIQAACSPWRHELHFCQKTERFPDVITLMRSLKGIGATHLHQGRTGGLTGRHQLHALQQKFPRENNALPLSYQLAYGVIYHE
ncbi:malonyl-ACP O-methyltransferase BioC [Edaphovirga cremea]|uniref:malonyl-ACP O-methyltransferase BioC n=1 Tax=Edaphovirga cremea TaxID=2267246 RepID=UPI003989C878